MSRSNVAGALHNLKGITANWNNPECVANAVFGFASSESLTCQYPLAKSRVENQACPLNELSESSMRGRGNASFFVRALSRR